MKLLRKLLVVIASAGVMLGFAPAGAQTENPDLGTISSTPIQQTEFFPSGSSFADIFNFSIAADQHTFLGSAGSFTPEGTSAEATHVSNLTLSVFDASGSEVGSVTSSNGTTINLSGVLTEGTYSLKISGVADGSLGGGYQFSVSAAPEPAGWAMLLAGLVVVTFMARRRASLVTG
jgi:MYXO-CTERM domain-containing protein